MLQVLEANRREERFTVYGVGTRAKTTLADRIRMMSQRATYRNIHIKSLWHEESKETLACSFTPCFKNVEGSRLECE